MTEVDFPPLDTASCRPVPVIAPPEVIFPGGFSLKGLTGLPLGSRMDVMQGMISQAMTGLMPEQPIFTLVEAVTAIFQVLTDLAPPSPQLPNPVKAAQDAVKVADAVTKLAAIPPVTSAPAFVKSLLKVIVLFLQGIVDEVKALGAQQARISAALDLASTADDPLLKSDLATIGACEQARLDAQMKNQAAAMGPLNTLADIIKPLVAAIPGVPPIPLFGDLGPDPLAAVPILEGMTDALALIVQVIP